MGKGGRKDFLFQGKISDILIRCARISIAAMMFLSTDMSQTGEINDISHSWTQMINVELKMNQTFFKKKL